MYVCNAMYVNLLVECIHSSVFMAQVTLEVVDLLAVLGRGMKAISEYSLGVSALCMYACISAGLRFMYVCMHVCIYDLYF